MPSDHQIPEGCSEDTLHKSLEQKLDSSLSIESATHPCLSKYSRTRNATWQIWIFDAKLDNGTLLTTSGLCTKIHSPIQQVFEECLSPPANVKLGDSGITAPSSVQKCYVPGNAPLLSPIIFKKSQLLFNLQFSLNIFRSTCSFHSTISTCSFRSTAPQACTTRG